MRRLVPALLLLLTGCASPLAALKARAAMVTEAGPFTIEYAPGDDAGAQKIRQAIETASPKLSRWGGIRERVHVKVMPSHTMLEQAVNRPGYAWLRAWARYDEVYIQTPRTWGLFGATQSDVNELMLHELTHCVMYQAAGTRTSWTRKGIPLWFREGMASFTARQAYRWPSLEDLARYYDEDPGRDPVGAPESLYQRDNDIVYAAAHHAFGFLVRRYGEDRVRAVLRELSQGAVFPEAFEQAVGISPQTFTNDFKRYVRLRGFRGGRLLKRATPVRPSEISPRLETVPRVEDEPDSSGPTGCHYR